MKKINSSLMAISSKKVKVRLLRIDEDLIAAGFSKNEVVVGTREYVKKKATRRITFESKGNRPGP